MTIIEPILPLAVALELDLLIGLALVGGHRVTGGVRSAGPLTEAAFHPRPEPQTRTSRTGRRSDLGIAGPHPNRTRRLGRRSPRFKRVCSAPRTSGTSTA